MTLLVTSIMCERAEAAVVAAEEALRRGSEAVEIRLDRWEDGAAGLAELAKALPAGGWIAACRPTSEGGLFQGDTAERVALLLAAGRAGDGYIDFEFADWQRSANIRQKIRMAVADRAGRGDGRLRLILSSHDFSGRPDDLAELAAAMGCERDIAGIKLAWTARDICDNFAAFDLLRGSRASSSVVDGFPGLNPAPDVPGLLRATEEGAGSGARGGAVGESRTGGVPTIALCMGEAGLPSRVLAKKFGALATYCARSAGDETAPGQVTLEQMLDCYRWAAIDEQTRFFGVIGDPVAHSMSPRLFNACFERENVNGVYLPLHVQADGDVLTRFLQGCQDRPWLDVGGFSVTVPHKQAAAAWVGDRIEPLARRIGAINTLVPGEDGLAGFNTDYAGALEAITATLACDRAALVDLRVDVLGAGGVARAIVAGLRDCGARVTLFNRSGDRAEALADEFDCDSRPWSDRHQPTEADLLINCTSLGMWPEVDATPVSADRFAKPLVVFDTVYNPTQTRLLREAAAAGCRTIDGLTMFVNQAALQWTLWTGQQTADKAFMRRVVERRLSDTQAE